MTAGEGDQQGKADPRLLESAGLEVPVVEEAARVEKACKVTGKVRVRKIVHEAEELIDDPLLRERVEVERVPIGKWVDEPPPVRSEGARLIIPVLEEVLVIEKRLRLKEELRLSWRMEEQRDPQRVKLRREEVQVERLDPDCE